MSLSGLQILTSDTRLIQAWLEHAVDLSLNRLDDLDGAKALAEMALSLLRS